MCLYNFVVLGKITVLELAYLSENIVRLGHKLPSQFILFINYVNLNPMMLFFMVVSFFTALALIAFYLFITNKYIRNLTFNEEDKFARTLREFDISLEQISKDLIDQKILTNKKMEELRFEVNKIEEWLVRYKQNYMTHSYVAMWVKLMIF